MKKESFLMVAFLIIVVAIGYIFFFKISDSPTGHVLLNKSSSLGSDKNAETGDSNKIDNSDNGASGSSGGLSGGSGGGSSGTDNKDANQPEVSQIPMCMLVRPGNLPDIGCFVSSIKKDSVSINLKNEIGEDIGVEIKLNSCSPVIKSTLENNQIKNFVFKCEEIEDYFNREVSISYILSDNKRVDISGFISGPVK
jgi:hypothetical protein